MKRRQADLVFYSLPIDVINKILSILQIVSLINLGRTCQGLYHLQQPYMQKVKTEMYDSCLKRIQKDLEKMDILDLLQNFLLKFGGHIGGHYVSGYISPNITYYPLYIYIPKSSSYEDTVNYIKDNINSETSDYVDLENNSMIICYTSNLICIRSMIIRKKFKNIRNQLFIKATIIHEDCKDKMNDFNSALDLPPNIMITDLKKVYCEDFWLLLHRQENLKEADFDIL